MKSRYRESLDKEILSFLSGSALDEEISRQSILTFKFYPPDMFKTWKSIFSRVEYENYVNWLITLKNSYELTTDSISFTIQIVARYITCLSKVENDFLIQHFKEYTANYIISSLIITSKIIEWPLPDISGFAKILNIPLELFWKRHVYIETRILNAFKFKFGIPPTTSSEIVRRLGYITWYIPQIKKHRNQNVNIVMEDLYKLDNGAFEIMSNALFYTDMALYDPELLHCNPYEIAVACLSLAAHDKDRELDIDRSYQIELDSSVSALNKTKKRHIDDLKFIIAQKTLTVTKSLKFQPEP